MPFRAVQLWLTVLVLVLAPLFLGSVEIVWIAIWTVLLSLGVLCGLSVPMTVAQSRFLLFFIAVCIPYALICTVQFAPDLLGRLNDPSWQKVKELLALDVSPRISIRGEIPAAALGHFLLLTTAFINGFCIGTLQGRAEVLMKSAQYAILVYASYGLISLMVTPDMILWAPKLAYRGSLTATFINRNTAATFVGAGAILWFCDALSALMSLRLRSIRLLLLSASNGPLAFRLIVRLLAALTCFAALLSTGSRAGLVCTCAGLFVAGVLIVFDRARHSFWRLVVFASVAFVAMVAIVSRLGRIGSGGLFDEGRWLVYLLSIDAIRERPLFGSGVGTFADLFPSLRTRDFYSWGVWDRAHSTILEIAVEMGIPITAAILAGSIASLLLLFRGATVSNGSSRKTIAAIAGVVVLSYLHAAVDFSLQIPGYFVMFGTLLGAGLAATCATSTKREDWDTAAPIRNKGMAVRGR